MEKSSAIEELSLPDNRTGFNFVLKEHRKGIIFMGSQIDNCFFIVYTNKQDGSLVYKKIDIKD